MNTEKNVWRTANEFAAERRLYRVVRRRRARTVMGVMFGILAALTITALLSIPKIRTEPVEVNGAAELADAFLEDAPDVTPAPVPTVSPTGALSYGTATEPSTAPTPSVQPTETAAPSTASTPTAPPAPTPESSYTQLSDWRLVLVNAEVELPADFDVTPRLYSNIEINSKIYDPLTEMLDAVHREGIVLWVASAYRSVETQERVLENAIKNRMRDYHMTREEAEEHALRTIQRPRHSEHHTGMAVDFNDIARDFHDTAAYAWLQEHAAEYGFVERYPEDKEDITGIGYEPWHYRYVGVEHATAMKELGMCLEEYCAYLQEN